MNVISISGGGTNINLPDGAGWFAAVSGVAVAPKWLLTSGHVWDNTTQQYFFDGLGGAHATVAGSGVQFGMSGFDGFYLIKLQTAVPEYAPVRKTAVSVGNTLKIIGRGKTGGTPIYSGSPVIGWKSGVQDLYLRWGSATVSSVSAQQFNWEFSGPGSNAPAPDYGDSGGPVFVGGEVAGIINYGAQAYNGMFSGVCETGFFVFSPYTNLRCPIEPGEDPFYHTQVVSTARATAVAAELSTIFNTIAPPVKLSASTTATNWTSYAFDEIAGWDPTNFTSTATINTDDVTDPAPQAVYKTIKWYSGSGTNVLRWSVPDLIVHEKYKVRVHMSSLVATGIIYPSQVIQSVAVTDASGQTTSNNIRPYWDGYNRASVVEFTNLTANASNTISGSVSVDTANGGTYAVISGVEVIRTP